MNASHHCGDPWDFIAGHDCYCPIGENHSGHEHSKDYRSSDWEEARDGVHV